MHIFIDESGTFAPTTTTEPSISAVGALTIPDAIWATVERKYRKLRSDLPTHKGEVKGRLLSEDQVSNVVDVLARHQVLFDVTAIDMGVHRPALVEDHKLSQAQKITENLTDRHSANVRTMLFGLRHELEAMTGQLYIQSVVTFHLLQTVIQHDALYYAQRMPRELGSFEWVIDAKAPDQITAWEKWWRATVGPMLQWRSFTEPLASLEGADYSHFERYRAKLTPYLKQFVMDPENEEAVSLTMLLGEKSRFSAKPEPGLELVDILVNAIRRSLMGALHKSGWKDIRRLMVHRKHQYVEMVTLNDRVMRGKVRPYFTVLEHFKTGGKNMLAPRFLNDAEVGP